MTTKRIVHQESHLKICGSIHQNPFHKSTDMLDRGLCRYEMYAPLFTNLYDNKIVYLERFLIIGKLDNIRITKDYFDASITIHLIVTTNAFRIPKRQWNIRFSWAMLLRTEKSFIFPYGNMTYWVEPSLVKEVETLVLRNEYKKAVKLLRD